MKQGADIPSGGPGRFPFIDLLRGLAVLFMMETHTINALLDPRLRQGFFHQSLTFLNGLVAPSFLFCAGLGFSIFVARKNDSIVRYGRSFRDYARKAFFIIFLGYSLHIPVYSLRGMAAGDSSVWKGFFQVDILQVIGVSLVLLLLLVTLLRTHTSRVAGISAVTAMVLFLSETTARGGLPDLPVWLLAYFSREVSPLFTLLPWVAFLTCGYLAGVLFVRASAAGAGDAYMKRIVYASTLALVAAAVLSSVTFPLYPPGTFWYSSIGFFVVRLSVILLVMAGLWRFFPAAGKGFSPVMLFGRESLPVYYFHLMIVYGKDFPFSYVRLFPQEMGYAGCIALTILLVMLMWGFAYGWNRLKNTRPSLAPLAVRGMVAFSIIVFVVS